jgi:Uma2 family endonuclease
MGRMATAAALVSVEEYLATTYKPACDYVDGVLYQKSMPTRKHGSIQIGLGQFINIGFPGFNASSEVNVRIRPGKYLVPDLIVQHRDRMQDPYPTEPVHLCIEILSPEDRISVVIAKCEEYHAWGVETVWIVDPENPRAWEFRKGQWPVEIPLTGSLTAPGISISLADLFSVL